MDQATFKILAPNSSGYSDLNDYSIVIKLVNGSNSFLFTGDAEELSEAEMLNKDSAILDSDILKVGHHGSASSTSLSFLNAVSPQYAVITVGTGNDYGHPSEAVINRLTAAGAKIYRTDKDGTVVFTSDGNRIAVDKAGPASAEGNTGAESPSNQESKTDDTPLSEAVNVEIVNVDKKGEIVTIKNKGSTDVDLTGWILVSVTGNQTFIFPSYILKANGTVTVASGGATGNLFWTNANVWNNSSKDPAHLYDAQWNLISSFDS